mmetsp:Transcript_17755/g.53596  ORF Transcript_17755/g.53596 Transcript_17755/m.53596 type:complete len:282 (-) Transcript_17755:204-1049(-)
MFRRANWIKVILLFIVFVLLATIVGIAWVKWGKKHSAPAAPSAPAVLATSASSRVFDSAPEAAVLGHSLEALDAANEQDLTSLNVDPQFGFSSTGNGAVSPVTMANAAGGSARAETAAAVGDTALFGALHVGKPRPTPSDPAIGPDASATAGRRISEIDFSAENKSVGAGVIVIFVFGSLTLVALFLAMALRPVLRCVVSFGVLLLFAAILLLLFLYPRADGSEAFVGRTDPSKLLRGLLAAFLILTALAGPVVILASHLAPQQKIRLPSELTAFRHAEGV